MGVEQLGLGRRLVRAALTRGTRRLLRTELKSSFVPKHPFMLARGFRSDSVQLYEFGRNDPDLYLNDRETVKTWSLVPGSYRPIVDNKLVFHLVLERLGFSQLVPELLGIVIDGVPAIRLNGCFERSDVEDLVAHAADDGTVVRPVGGHGGHGVAVAGHAGAVSGTCDLAALINDVAGRRSPAMLTRFVENHPDLAALHLGSVSTTRVLTVWPIGSSAPRVVRPVVQQIGTASSAPFGSWGNGGLSCELDDGRMVGACQLDDRGRLRRLDHHPESGERIAGRTVPYWEETITAVVELASAFPGLPYVLWEFVVGSTGPRLVEANHNPGIQSMQVHKPLLRDDGMCAVLHENRLLEATWRSPATWQGIVARAAAGSDVARQGPGR